MKIAFRLIVFLLFVVSCTVREIPLVFDKENTRMFFDVIDRRYSKEGPNNMIFTSNKTPDKWGEFFGEDSSLLCALDRIFDDALVFMIKGNSYRGQNCRTVSITAGELSPLPKTE